MLMFAVTPCVCVCVCVCVSGSTVCFIFFYHGVDFRNLGDFLVLERAACFLTI